MGFGSAQKRQAEKLRWLEFAWILAYLEEVSGIGRMLSNFEVSVTSLSMSAEIRRRRMFGEGGISCNCNPLWSLEG